MKKIDALHIKGARENNLQNINVIIPKNQLVVLTGVSGSGKSSLAFNTIYEEGRRRYVDSLSSYARQFLGGTKKPDVDQIEGLSPSISIEQKTTHNNPRSTVGTVTEILDYLRLLYARVGRPFCPKHNIEITAQKTKDIIDSILSLPKNTRILVMSPQVQNLKGTHKNLLTRLKRSTFVRVLIDKQVYSLDDVINLDKNVKHTIDIIVDRLVITENARQTIASALENALQYGNGVVKILNFDTNKETTYSQLYSCPFGDFEMPKIETRLFSFNAPYGMCDTCKGLGVELKASWEAIVPDPRRSIRDGGILFFRHPIQTDRVEWQEFEAMLNYYKIDINKSINQLSEFELDIIKYGSIDEIQFSTQSQAGNKTWKNRMIEGILPRIERRYFESTSQYSRMQVSRFMGDKICSTCHGARLNPFALAVKIDGYNLNELTKVSIEDLFQVILNFKFSDHEKEIVHLILIELINRISFLIDVGLDYLSLHRNAETLSGGEAQRIRLATQIGSKLTGVLYVLDEPSIGLHQKDNIRLINTLKEMVSLGNTLIVVEHDEDTIRQADHIVDVGPLAGKHGGTIVAQGTANEIAQVKESITGRFLSGEWKIGVPKTRRKGKKNFIEVKGANKNNLKNLKVDFPLNRLVCVTGVSGSGKSTLVNEELVQKIKEAFRNFRFHLENYEGLSGLRAIDKVVEISQSPIGRTPRSNPATYTSVFDNIRDVFASAIEAKARGYAKGRFSFNVAGGRCDKCRGDGSIKIEMHFLPDVYVTCDHCEGKRYNTETLDIKYRNKSIYDVLEMTVEDALEFFNNRPKIEEKLQTLFDVGLGYMKLGQSSTTLSGGEAQRVKLATHLLKKATGKTIYVLDEPTTGLHSYDIAKLLKILGRIVDNGDTVIVIEHNLDVIKNADYIIDLGPGGGIHGGKVVAKGTPEEIANNPNSFTGKFLKPLL